VAGYSQTPLAKKLGIKGGMEILVISPPCGYRELVQPLPEDVDLVTEIGEHTNAAHIFATSTAVLVTELQRLRNELAGSAFIWASLPKKASRMETDITENTIRELALPMGLVDIKVCAVDDVWSGLKLVVRKELR